METLTTYLELRGSRRPYRPIQPQTATAAACTAARRVGPMTRQQLIELVWRVREIELTTSVSYTKFTTDPEEDPELPGETVTESGTQTVNQILPGEVEFELFYKNNFIERNGQNNEVVYSQDPFNAGLSFYLWQSIYKDEEGEFWIDMVASSKKDSSAWFRLGRSGDSDTVTEPEILFMGTITLLGASINFPMRTTTVYAVYSVNSASCTVAPSGWHEFATTQGDPAWSPTTGAAVNGGPLA